MAKFHPKKFINLNLLPKNTPLKMGGTLDK
jgi:hypothetical protein